ncbi:MAG TPA: hypothetical protein VD886_11455 [Herpetosiphonaceae bacterium]|nr:hypothetical protein [Herpetosiphonaceae bacterium]
MVCASDSSKTFSTRGVSYAACGPYSVDNTATVVATDTGAANSDSVSIRCACPAPTAAP